MNKHLKQEIAGLLSTVEQVFTKDSREFQNIEYLLDILECTYRCNYDGERDLLDELNKLLIKLSRDIPEFAPENFNSSYPSINTMIKYLGECLPK